MDLGVSELLNRIRALEEENIQAKTLLAMNNATSTSSYPEPHVNLPERFDGTRTKLRSFLNQVRLLFELQPKKYPTERIKVGLVGTLLTGVAAAWFCPLFESNSPILDDFSLFTQELKQTFGDYDKEITSATKIRSLQQGQNPASVYVTEFRLLASDLSWGEQALIDQFRWGLNDSVKDLLLTLPLPKTLSEAISNAVRCDNRIGERMSEKISTFIRKGTYPEETTTSQAVPMDIDVIKNQQVRKNSKSWRANEKARRFQQNLCLYCGAPGHQVRNCPRKQPNSLNERARPQ